jgi:invasion protein IalB
LTKGKFCGSYHSTTHLIFGVFVAFRDYRQAGLFPVSAILFAALAAPVQAEQSFADWAASCDDGRPCALAQTLMSDDRIWLGSIVLSSQNGSDSRDLALYVPQGVHLASGIYLGADPASPARGEWITCDDRACMAHLSLTPAEEARMKAGRSAELRYRPSPEAPVIVLDVSLMGISAGLSAIDAGLAQ